MRRDGGPPRRPTRSRNGWTLSRRLSPVLGEILLEVLRTSRGRDSSSTEIASERGILIEDVSEQPPARRAAWKRSPLPKADLAANNALAAPLLIGKRWRILPAEAAWHRRPTRAPGSLRTEIRIQPAIGFGSGSHETTRLCLRLMECLPAARSMLDLGTGSGILAIAAVKSGAPRAVGLEIDPMALRSARNHSRLNGCRPAIRWIRADVATWNPRERFDLITANLLGGLLISQAPRLGSWLARNGRLVLSGILRGEQKAVAAAFLANGLHLRRVLRESRWCALLLERDPA